MDNTKLYKNKVQMINQRTDREHMEELLDKPVRTAVDMDKIKDGYDKEHYSMRRTEKEAMEIDGLLKTIEAGDFLVEEKDRSRLEAIQGRNLSHLMLNDRKFTGDSVEMKNIKTALGNLEIALTNTREKALTENNVDHLMGLYQKAMEECQYYIDNKHPKRETGKRRKAMVQATLKRIMKESDALDLGRRIIAEGGSEAKKIKSGLDLLSLVAVQDFTEKMSHKKLKDEKAELEAEHKLKKQLYTDDRAKLDELIAKKSEKLSFWQKAMVFADKDVIALNNKLMLNERAAELIQMEKRIGEISAKQELEKTGKKAKRDDKNKKAQEERKGAEDKINALPEELKILVKLLADGTEPASLIKNKKKIKSSDKKMLNEVITIFNALKTFKPMTEEAKTIRVGGAFVRLCQDEVGNLSIKLKDTQITLANTAADCLSVISTDVITNRKLYGDDAVRDIITDCRTDLAEMSRGDLLRTREYSTSFLFEEVGIPRAALNNFDCGELKKLALDALAVKGSKERLKAFKDKLMAEIKLRNEKAGDVSINTVLNLELQNVGRKESEGIILEIPEKQEDNEWDEKERKVRDLAADLIFSKDTWVADGLSLNPEERIRRVLIDHAEAIALIVSDQFRDKKKEPEGLVEKMIEKLPLFSMEEDELEDFKESIKDALDEIHSFVKTKVDNEIDGDNELAKTMAETALKTPAMLVPLIKNALGDLNENDIERLKKLDKAIDESVSENMSDIQKTFDDSVDEIFENKKTKEKENEEEKLRQNDQKDNKKHLNQLEKKEKESGLDDWERSELKRLKKDIEDSEADDADKKLVAESTQKLNDHQKQLSNLHKEMDEFKTTIAGFVKDSQKASKEEKKDYDAHIRRLKDELKKLEDTEKDLSTKYRNENKIINDGNKRLRMRAVRRRMDKRMEQEELIRSDILKCEIKLKKLRADLELPEGQVDRNLTETAITELEDSIKMQKQNLEKEIKQRPKRTAEELEKILEDSAKGGEKGQSLFMKNVLKTYFKSMPVIDQRSMLASAFRNGRPVPRLSVNERENLSKDQKLVYMSDFLGGMFKGAGPLFQKMLQGLPKSSLPQGLKKAVEDTQDSLAPIPDEVVMAHMEGIKHRSNKKISRIEVKRSLGAASVGQAFLCRIYGPKMKDGKDVVIKLLRPDVRNRMMREKEVMLNAARMTDSEGKTQSEIDEMRRKGRIGGMEATYMGNLQRIEEELDLTIEAKNCKEGQIYDEKIRVKKNKRSVEKENLCDSMKMSDIVEATSDTCMMEIAGSRTVKRYMSDMEQKTQQLLEKFCVKEKEKDKNGQETGREVLKKNEDGSYELKKDMTPGELNEFENAKKEMAEMLKDMELRTKALAQLVEKWVTQGVFEKGYYHGDLHAGNIMISEKGVTVIDFGNATTLNPEQQKHITRMMVAATMGDVEKFRHGFHLLLENTPEEVYQEKREELTLLFKEVMSMGTDDNPAERIAVALVRAQELGIELPPTIANFSSCQMRLQNTLTDMNNALKAMRNNVKKLDAGIPLSTRYVTFDVVAKFMQDSKRYSMQKKKETIWRLLNEREFTGKEEFRQRLKDKSFRDDFFKQYGFQAVSDDKEKKAEFKKIDGLLSGKIELSNEDMERYDLQDMDHIYPALAEIKNANKEDPVKSAFFSELMDVLDTLIYTERSIGGEQGKEALKLQLSKKPYLKDGAPRSLNELIDKIKKSNNDFKDIELSAEVREMDRKLNDYHKALDAGKTSEADLAAMEDELYDMYKKEYEQDKLKKIEEKKKEIKKDMERFIPVINTDGTKDVQKQLRMNRDNSMDIFKRAVETCIANKANGEQLKKESDELYEIWEATVKDEEGYKNNIEKFKEKYSAVGDLLIDAQTQMYHELGEKINEKITVEDEDPESFLSIMGDVMNRKKMDLLFRLDMSTSFKIWWNS